MAQEIINGEVVQTITIPLQEYISNKQNDVEILRQEVEQKNLQIQEILEELQSLLK